MIAADDEGEALGLQRRGDPGVEVVTDSGDDREVALFGGLLAERLAQRYGDVAAVDGLDAERGELLLQTGDAHGRRRDVGPPEVAA